MKKMDEKSVLMKKLMDNSAARHDLWEGSGVLLSNEDFEEEVQQTSKERDELMERLKFFTEAEKPSVEIKNGWYQDGHGNLYKYDGVIWSPIPPGRVIDLEYLSGE